MPVVGQPRTFDKKFAFQLHIDGFGYAGFMKCSELKVDVAKIEHYEGGTLLPQKSPGRANFADITLERGAVRGDIDMYKWMSQVIMAPANLGLKETAIKRMADLVQLDRDGEVLKRYTISWAWPTSFTAGEWDNTVDENTVEKLTLAYDYYVRTQ
jgi:phage tail-like protein